MDPSFQAAVELFNTGRYHECQDALESLVSDTRAVSDRQFYALLDNVCEAMLQLGDGDLGDAEEILQAAQRRMEEFLPRFRGLNVAALRDDVHVVIGELRDVRRGGRTEWAPSRLPRLRVLPG